MIENNLEKRKSVNPSWTILALLLTGIFYSSCYYDVEEELYTEPLSCDTTNVTFSVTVTELITLHCQNCHSSSLASGGVVLDTYDGIKTQVDNGKLISSITHDGNAVSMPPSPSAKIPSCAIDQISAWVNNGAPNN